ncbi:MAG: ChaN family lipoprotein [Ideonella sp.]|nr:ChaN family lipoprotein [Ideonella sp.]
MTCPLSRRALLLASTASMWGCQARRSDASALALQDRALSVDFVALGELHDNPHHHRLRAEWVAAWCRQAKHLRRPSGRGPAVVLEHLPQGAVLHWSSGDDLLSMLSAQGFDAKGWRWPVHQPLMEGLLAAACPIQGGNLPKDMAKRVVREGTGILSPALQAWIANSPLTPAALADLEHQLRASHCQTLPERLLPGMVHAQRARDAAMADTMAKAWRLGHRPVVLMAGNGHTRRDWGVPQMLQQRLPHATCLSVALSEDGNVPTAASAQAYDLLWPTPPAARPPSCPH